MIFKNTDWLVMESGIEALVGHPGYWIDMERVDQETDRQGITYYDWPIHLAEKEWVAISLFLEAFTHALTFAERTMGLTIDRDMLQRTSESAIEEAAQTQQYKARRKDTWLSSSI